VGLVKEIRAAAEKMAIEVQVFEVLPLQFHDAFKSMVNAGAGALVIQQTALFTSSIPEIANLALDFHLPAIEEIQPFAEAGGLMAYGPNITALGQRAAYYVDRILTGTNPADLPVEQPTKFDLVINLKTAKALGISIPQTLIATADKVIE
jgi:putative ABC transport system substrate-binding protein